MTHFLKRSNDRAKEAKDLLEQLRAYRGSDMYQTLIKLLGAVEDCYREELLTAPADRIAKMQGGAGQCRILYELLHQEGTPRGTITVA
jgi:hypothetical protein